MECARLEVLPRLGKPLAHPLSNVAITTTIRVTTHRQGWPFSATVAAFALAILTNLPRHCSHPAPPHTSAGDGLLQGTPLPPCHRPTSSVLTICSCRTRAHSSSRSLASSPALPSSVRNAVRKVVAAAGGAWERAALEGSR